MPAKVKKKPSLKKTYLDLATKSLRDEIKVLRASNKQLKAALAQSEKNRNTNLETLKELRIKQEKLVHQLLD